MDPIIGHALMLTAAGLLSGFLAGLLGIGGGIVTIPVLFLVFGELGTPDQWKMHAAIGTSLAIIIATNISSVRAHHKKGAVNWDLAKTWAVAIVVGSVAGSFFATTLKTVQLVYIFASLAAFLAIKMMLPFDHWKLGSSLPTGIFRYLNPAVIGFFSAIMGIGGGSFSVPYMTLYSVPIHRAVGTASLIGLFISFAAAMGYVVAGETTAILPNGFVGFIHLPSVLVVALAAVFMAPVGARVAHKLPKTILSIAFGLFLIAATLRLISAV